MSFLRNLEEFCNLGLSFRGTPVVVRPCRKAKWVNVTRLSYGIPDDVIVDALRPYGQVINVKMDSYKGVYVGVRNVLMEITTPIPSSIRIADHWCNVFYPGQVPTCFSCREAGHTRANCPRGLVPPPRTTTESVPVSSAPSVDPVVCSAPIAVSFASNPALVQTSYASALRTSLVDGQPAGTGVADLTSIVTTNIVVSTLPSVTMQPESSSSHAAVLHSSPALNAAPTEASALNAADYPPVSRACGAHTRANHSSTTAIIPAPNIGAGRVPSTDRDEAKVDDNASGNGTGDNDDANDASAATNANIVGHDDNGNSHADNHVADDGDDDGHDNDDDGIVVFIKVVKKLYSKHPFEFTEFIEII